MSKYISLLREMPVQPLQMIPVNMALTSTCIIRNPTYSLYTNESITIHVVSSERVLD